MQIVLHTGAFYTEEDRLLRCLLNNKDILSKEGIAVPGPSKYRALLRKTIIAMMDAPLAPDARDVLIDLILDEEDADRVLLSHMYLFGPPHANVKQGLMYWLAPERMVQIASLFPQDKIELCLAMRNPATFLPQLMQSSPHDDMPSFLRGHDPLTIRWSETIRAIRTAAPDIPITTWCFEDMPLIWGCVIREIAGLDPQHDIKGDFELLSDIMSDDGTRRFQNYLETHPKMNEMQKRRVITTFLDKFALDDAIEEEINAPGWNEETIDRITDIYEEDVSIVSQIPGVTVILP